MWEIAFSKKGNVTSFMDKLKRKVWHLLWDRGSTLLKQTDVHLQQGKTIVTCQ